MSKLLLMSFTSAVLISFASSVMAAERITTLRTPDGVLVKKIVRSNDSSAAASLRPLGSKSQAWGGCGLVPDSEECAGSDTQTTWIFQFDYLGMYQAEVRLDQVVTEGRSICTILVQNQLALPGCVMGGSIYDADPFLSQLPPEARDALGGTVDGLLADGQPEVLPKCMVVTTVPNPNADVGQKAAYAAIWAEYKDSISKIIANKANPVYADVTYPNGDIIRYAFYQDSPFGGGDWLIAKGFMVYFQVPTPCRPKA